MSILRRAIYLIIHRMFRAHVPLTHRFIFLCTVAPPHSIVYLCVVVDIELIGEDRARTSGESSSRGRQFFLACR
jgi:hypothetical protein